MRVLGFVLIVCGVMAGASGASQNLQFKGVRNAQQQGELFGSVLFSVVMVVGGFFILRSAERKSKADRDDGETPVIKEGPRLGGGRSSQYEGGVSEASEADLPDEVPPDQAAR